MISGHLTLIYGGHDWRGRDCFASFPGNAAAAIIADIRNRAGFKEGPHQENREEIS
jgi:hypothetical protein